MIKIIFCCVFLLCTMSSPLSSLQPRIMLGIGTQGLLVPITDQLLAAWYALNAEGLISYRTLLSPDSYLSLLAEVEAGIIPSEDTAYLDEELVFVEAGFDINTGRLIFTTEYNSSFTGTFTETVFYSGEWKFQYYFNTGLSSLNPFVTYNGYVRFEPLETNDIFTHEGRIGFEFRPSMQSGYEVGAAFRWEEWFDSPVYTATGTEGNIIRNDYLGICSFKAFGTFGFFIDWAMEIHTTLRWSNANRYLAVITSTEEHSEDRFSLEFEGKLDWSPIQQVTIRIVPKFGFDLYFYRSALSDSGTALKETTYTLATGGIFHLDWTPDNNIYLLAEIQGFWDFSNDSTFNIWECLFKIGIRYGFD